MVRLTGFEPATPGVGGQCSIQLSYKRMSYIVLTGHPGALSSVIFLIIANSLEFFKRICYNYRK